METLDWKLIWAACATLYGFMVTIFLIPLSLSVRKLMIKTAVHETKIDKNEKEIDKLWDRK